MEYKYFRFTMNDGSEGKRWGYSMGNGEYVSSDESISFDAIDEIPYDEATGVLRSWLKKHGVVTNTIEIDTVVANAYSKGSASARFMYEDGGYCKITVETTSNPTVEWEDVSLNKDSNELFASRTIKSSALDLTTERFTKVPLYKWGEITPESRKVGKKLNEDLIRNELYAEDLLVKQDNDIFRVAIVIDGDWKHEHLRLDDVMQKLGYMHLSTKEIGDSDSDYYEAEHQYVSFPDYTKFLSLSNSRKLKSSFTLQIYDDRNPSKIIQEIKGLPSWRTAFNKAENLCDTTYSGWRYIDYDIIPDNTENSNLGNYMSNSRNTEESLNKIFSSIK